MNKNILFPSLIAIAVIAVLSISGCSKPTTTPVDESGYLGTYYGKHYLSDSQTIRGILNDPAAQMIYDDTLIVTNGSNSEDGKLNANSSLLGGSDIEFDVNTGNITPVLLGNISILGTVLQNCKAKSGSTANWSSDKSTVTTFIAAAVTYNFNGTPINLDPVSIKGSFTKQ